MKNLAERGIDPSVVDDQIGRLTFTDDLAGGIEHLLKIRPEQGVYNLTSAGEPTSWAEIAQQVYRHTGHAEERVTPVPTAEYYRSNGCAEGDGTIAVRPRHSMLDLSKISNTGFQPDASADIVRGQLKWASS